MSTWSEPLADKIAQSRHEIEDAVKNTPESVWQQESEYAGWTFKDQLSHMGGAHLNVHNVLGAVIDGNEPDFSVFLNIDKVNEERRQATLDRSVDALVAQYLEASEKTVQLFREIPETATELKFGPMSIEQAMTGFTLHDPSHLSELRKATA